MSGLWLKDSNSLAPLPLLSARQARTAKDTAKRLRLEAKRAEKAELAAEKAAARAARSGNSAPPPPKYRPPADTPTEELLVKARAINPAARVWTPDEIADTQALLVALSMDQQAQVSPHRGVTMEDAAAAPAAGHQPALLRCKVKFSKAQQTLLACQVR